MHISNMLSVPISSVIVVILVIDYAEKASIQDLESGITLKIFL